MGGGGGVGLWGWVGQDGCERRIEVFCENSKKKFRGGGGGGGGGKGVRVDVKIQKKNFFLFFSFFLGGEGGSGWGGGGQGGCEQRIEVF